MAFCKYCGTQIEDGGSCTCERAMAAQNVSHQNNVEVIEKSPEQQEMVTAVVQDDVIQTREVEGTTELVSKGKNMVALLWKQFVSIWKSPAEETEKFVKDGDLVIAISFVVIQALFSGLLMVAQIGRVEDKLGTLLNGMSSLLGEDMQIEFPYVEGFFYTLFISIVISALFFGCYYLIMLILKIQAEMKSLLCLTAARSVASIPFTLVAFVFTFINPWIGIVINVLALIMAYTFLLQGISGIVTLGESKEGYVTAVVNTAVIIIISFVASFVINNKVEELMSHLSSYMSYLF